MQMKKMRNRSSTNLWEPYINKEVTLHAIQYDRIRRNEQNDSEYEHDKQQTLKFNKIISTYTTM
jgi:hypothetical protein